MRSAAYVAWLAWRRLRRRDSGAVVAALGLTVAAAILAAVFAGVTIAADRATADAVERIPPAGSAARAIWFGVPAADNETQGVLDGEVRDALAGLSLPGPTELVLFREATVAGHFVGIAAVDRLAPYVELRSGRLPRRCTAERCEVLRLRGEGRLPDTPGLRLVEVGTAKLVSRRLLGDFLGPNDDATADAELGASLGGRYHEPDPAPLVIAEGVDALAESTALSRLYRSYAWVWPIEPGKPRLWGIDALLGELERARAALARTSTAFTVNGPEEELRAAERKAEIGARRLLLVGGEAAALLLAFALLAARTLRRDLRAAHARLTWYGARRWQLGLLTGVESGLVAVGGVLLGWLVGTGVGAIAAVLTGAPAWEVLRESTLSATGLLLAAGAALVTAGLVTLVVSLRAREGSRFGVPEALAAGALLVAGVALLDGGLDEERLARGGSSVVLLLLVPGLVALVGAVLVARLVPVAARFVADRRRGSTAVRLAALGLTRGAGAAAVTAAFLTIAFALSLLAEGYRATLTRGERESAAFQVPLDVTVREDPGSLVRVFDAAPLDRYKELAGPEGGAYPVLRVSASAGRAARVTGVTVLGVDRPVLERLRVWRNEWAGGRDRTQTASLVEPGRPVTLRGAALPDGEIVVTAGPERIGLAAIVETPAGEFRRVDLGSASTSSSTTLRARVPRGSRLVSLELVPPPRLIEGGANAGIAYEGSVRLGGPLARELREWVGVDGAESRPAGAGVDVDFALTLHRTTRLRARQATDDAPPAVLVTPALAELAGGIGGELPLRVGGSAAVARVAGVIERFPGAEGDVVVGDRGALRTALNTAVPGSARENEVWLDLAGGSTGGVKRAFAERPLDTVSSTLRADLEAEAAGDPIARGTVVALGAAALLALVLAAVGLALAVRSELRDERGELYELEALGASPSLLRAVVRLRALGVSLAGFAAGLLTGIVLVALVTRIVSVTAQGGFAEPPLVATVDVRVLVAGLAVFAALGAVLVGVSTRRAFSSPRGPLATRERTDMAPLVETRELFAVYPSPTGGVAALQGLTLAVEEGETCVVLGPSGSGKTTLMRILAGLERPSAGAAVVAGLDLGHASGAQLGSYRSRTLGYADQHYWRALAGELTAEELVAVPLGLHGMDEEARRARARELLERVGLLDRADASPSELSGGEQQRIALCAALSHRPRLLLADEPTGELDAASAAEVFALLAELVDEQGATGVVVSHDPTATGIADRVVHLRDGRVSEEQRGGEETVVVGAGGWLRVPEEVLAAAGIVRRARVVATDGVVELHPAVGDEQAAPAAVRSVSGRAGGVLEARGVSRRYGPQVALDSVDAVFRPGELAVVTGPSGSGKSTLLTLLAGLDLPDEGEVLLDGAAVSSLDRDARAALRRDRIAVVLQTARLADFLTAAENVELGLALAGVTDRAESAERVAEALAAVDLAQHADRRVGVLSAGQRERVALARAFAARPAVVLADEPTARLDAATTLAIGDLLVRLARETATTVVCATHDPLLIGIADRELRLDAGAAAVASA